MAVYYPQRSSRQAAEPLYARSPCHSGPQQLAPSRPPALVKPGGGAPYGCTSSPVHSGPGPVLAHSPSQSGVHQGAAAPPPGAGGPCSPLVQIRASRANQVAAKDAMFVRAVATPLRGEDTTDWSAHNKVRLGSDADAARFAGRARLLDRNIGTIGDAVDCLNRRLVWCPEDCCIVAVPAERACYMIYRCGRRVAALAQLGLAPEGHGASVATSAASERKPSWGPVAARAPRQESRGSTAQVSRQASLTVLEPPGSANFAAAAPAAASSARCGKPPLRTCAARAASGRGAAQSYLPPPTAQAEDGRGAGYPRYASPAARVMQAKSYHPPPTAAWATAAAGAATPTPPAPVAPASAARLAENAAPRPPPEPPQPPAPRLTRAPTHAAALPPAQAVAAAAGPHGAPVAQHRLSTPRETLERDLTELEKIKFSELDFLESLGSGEFGQVFRGTYQQQEVAIKQLYWDDTMTELVMQDLAKEIESFRHLRHKRLVRFIGACLELPHPCLVTEYMPGGSLHHLLHVRKLQLPMHHALNMCLQVADGVMYLHSQTPVVVHRDLKSLNVVLDLSLNIKICDFGLTEPMERTHITKKNNGGSPRYMAPELFDSNTKITEKIDVWAMGCIFVEICGGPLPYETITTLADLTREMLVHRRTPDVPEYIPSDARRIIVSCMSFDYRHRPTSKVAFEELKAAKKQLRVAGLLD